MREALESKGLESKLKVIEPSLDNISLGEFSADSFKKKKE